ncbi:hypothetical protein WA026_023282 [Henosepilachna vigintioctopunctata]|uniref:Uncharacterized protein n=1 Tax=Henosepilachna vigintioctopunctata TaxID=420089 RepID=A0AAW1UCK9_9CUCU
MAANKKVGACNDPLLETSKCGYCRSSNGLKCSICPKVFQPSCSMKLKKCCDVEITEILITDKVSEETAIMEPKSTDITTIPTTMKLSNDVNITTNNENSINDTAPNTAEHTWSTVAAKKIPRRGNVDIVFTGVNNNTDIKKNGTKGAIKKR